MNRDQLIASGQALLDLDARGALVPHGIGGHAREIIEGFIALSSLPAQAVGVITWADIRENFGSTDLSIFDLLAAVNDIIAKRSSAPSQPAAVGVTDGMVERATEALAQSFRDTVARVSAESWEDTGVTLPSREVFERYARAALEAALVHRDQVKL